MLIELLCGTAPFSNEEDNLVKTKKQIKEAEPVIPEFVSYF